MCEVWEGFCDLSSDIVPGSNNDGSSFPDTASMPGEPHLDLFPTLMHYNKRLYILT